MLDSKPKKNEKSLEIFGTPVYFIDGMVRLKDIQNAYLGGGGSKGARSTDPNQWFRLASTSELVDYLGTLQRSDSVVNYPKGDRGGTFASRELAHSYAMWLSPIYAVSVLIAFDHLVSGQMFKATTEANSVAKRMMVESWSERADRLDSNGWDMEEGMYYLANFVAPVFALKDMKDFLEDISNHLDACAFFETCCNTLETALYFSDGDTTKAEEYTAEVHSEDPRREALDIYLKEYADGSK